MTIARPRITGSLCDGEYQEARRRLSFPDRTGLSRRRFLQAALAGAGTMVLSDTVLGRGLSRIAEAATPLSPGQGVLVVILLGGGNDGFNMVVPASDPAYYSARGSIAVPADTVLPLDHGFGFHPSLPKLADRYRAGKVACVMGVGYPSPNLSHFTSMANWMSGQPGVTPTSGWLGRWLDDAGNADGLTGVAVDNSVPLHLVGRTTTATALPTSLSNAFGAKASNHADTALFQTLASFSSGSSGLGEWGDAVAANSTRAMDLAATVSSLYSPALPSRQLATQLTLAARLINANLGVRVIGVEWGGDFDVHADEVGRQRELMAGLDAGIDSFYAALDQQWSGSVTLMTFSEFGRRVKSNQSGTDHGTASNLLVIGDRVAGGIVGDPPSLTSLDHTQNAVMTTDYRSVYSTVLADWLQGDPEKVLGGSFAHLPLFSGPPGAGGSGSGSGSVAGAGTVGATASASGPGYFMATSDGTVYGFGRSAHFPTSTGAPAVAMAAVPGRPGAWLVRSDGSVIPGGAAPALGDLAGTRLASPIRGMAATPSGNGYWLVASDGGIFTFGDAGFFGSTGAMRLARPVVGMASTPTGRGYWLVASDGGIFTFGDAGFFGSAGSLHLAKPIIGMAPSPSGRGYLLAASDGGVFSFGDAAFHGALGGSPPKHPVVALAG